MLTIEDGWAKAHTRKFAGMNKRLTVIEADFQNVKKKIEGMEKEQQSNAEHIKELQHKTD